MFRIRTFMLLIVLVALPALLFAQEQAPADQAAAGNAVRLDQLIGTSIANQDNSFTGTIQDFVLSQVGEVRHVVVSEQAAGAQAAEPAMPEAAPGTEQGETAQAPAAEAPAAEPAPETAQAPATPDQGAAAGADQGQMAQAGQARVVPIEQVTFSGATATINASSDEISQLPTMTGADLPGEVTQASAGEQLVLATRLMDATVMGQDNQEVGQLQGAMLDTQANRILYFAVAPAGTLGLGEALYAVPMDVVSGINPDQGQIMINIPANQVSQYQGFGQDSWPQSLDAAGAAPAEQPAPTTEGAPADATQPQQ